MIAFAKNVHDLRSNQSGATYDYDFHMRSFLQPATGASVQVHLGFASYEAHPYENVRMFSEPDQLVSLPRTRSRRIRKSRTFKVLRVCSAPWMNPHEGGKTLPLTSLARALARPCF